MKAKNWFKPKGYTHLTYRVGIHDAGFINSYVSNSYSVATHRFYPLIHRTIFEKKYKKVGEDENGKPIRKHYTKVDGKKKSTAKPRQIYYANHLDAHIYSYYAQKILSPLYEEKLKANAELDEAIIAYRRIEVQGEDRCKCNIDFANEVFEIIKNLKGDYTVIAFDISKFFDSLDHKILKQAWSQLLGRIDLPEDHYKIYRSLVDFDYVELESVLLLCGFRHPNELIQKEVSQFLKTGEDFRQLIKAQGLIRKNPFRHDKTKIKMGIPQGTPLSAFLANLYMLKYDEQIIQFLKSHNGIYRRYSDDILAIVPTEVAEETKKYVIDLIADYQLVIQEAKTQSTRFIDGTLAKVEQPVSYLGFQFDGKRKRLRPCSVSKYYRNLKRLIRYKALRAKKMKKKNFLRGIIYKKDIYNSYSHLGSVKSSNRKRNYYSYVKLAATVMNEPGIKKQLSNSWEVMHRELRRHERKNKLIPSSYYHIDRVPIAPNS